MTAGARAEPAARAASPFAMATRVVVVKPCCIGDVLLASPLVAAIHAANPAAEVHWAAATHSREAAQGVPGVARVIPADGAVPGAFSLAAVLRLVGALKAGRYEAALIPDRSRILALVPALAGIAHRAGLDSGGRGRWHTVRVPVVDGAHEGDLYLAVARLAGLPVAEGARLAFHPTAADREKARAALAPGDPARPMVAIHPGGGVNPGMSLLEKRWAPERFANVARQLARSHGAAAVVLGGVADAEVATAVATGIGEGAVINLAGRLTLGETAAVIEACSVYIGSDSGIAHLAAAVGCPVVVIFGPTDPARYGPRSGAGEAVAPGHGPAPVRDLAAAAGSTAVAAVTVVDVLAAVERVARW